jgi:hypothetical protein
MKSSNKKKLIPRVSNIIQTAPRTSALAEQLPPLSISIQPGLAPGFWLCVLIVSKGVLIWPAPNGGMLACFRPRLPKLKRGVCSNLPSLTFPRGGLY